MLQLGDAFVATHRTLPSGRVPETFPETSDGPWALVCVSTDDSCRSGVAERAEKRRVEEEEEWKSRREECVDCFSLAFKTSWVEAQKN